MMYVNSNSNSTMIISHRTYKQLSFFYLMNPSIPVDLLFYPAISSGDLDKDPAE